MKSCYVNIDKLTGVVELEAIDDIKTGDVIISELDKGTCLGTVVTEPAETERGDLLKDRAEGNGSGDPRSCGLKGEREGTPSISAGKRSRKCLSP